MQMPIRSLQSMLRLLQRHAGSADYAGEPVIMPRGKAQHLI